jgi:HEAT repeat protein
MGERTAGAGRGGRASDWLDLGDDEAGSRDDRRRSPGLTGPLSLGISGLVLYVAWCVVWERSHPAASPARGMRQGRAAARLKAIHEVERIGPQDPEVALPALIGGLSDPDPKNRMEAARGLVAVIQGLEAANSDPELVHDAVTALLGRMADPQPDVRTRVAQALWMIVLTWRESPRFIEPQAVAAAMDAACLDGDDQVRLAGVRGLGVVGQRLGDDPPPRLFTALEDPSESVRGAAAQALAMYSRGLPRLVPALIKSLEAARPEHRPAYLGVLKHVGLSMSRRGSTPAQEMIAALLEGLASGDRQVCCQLLSVIGEFRHKARDLVPALLAIVAKPADEGPAGSSADDPVAAAAAALARVAGVGTEHEALGTTKVPSIRAAVPPLLKLLESPAAGRRLAAVEALPAFEPDDALVVAMVRSSRDPDAAVRAAALRGLPRIGARLQPPWLGAVATALEDGSPEVRTAAASALRGAPSGLDPMIPALLRHAEADPDRRVRDECSWVLGTLGPPAVTAAVLPLYVAAIDRDGAPTLLRSELIGAMATFGPEARDAAPAIVRALRAAEADPRRDDRPWGSVGQPRTPSGVQEPHPLREAGERVALRARSARALGLLAPGTPTADDAVSALAAALDDPDDGVNQETIQALLAFDTAARPAAPSLVGAIRKAGENKDLWRAGRLIEALRRIEPTALGTTEVVALLDGILDARDIGPRLFAQRILTSLGPAAARAVPRLIALSRRPVVRANEEVGSVATALGRIAPGTPEEDRAIAALEELLEVEPELHHVEVVIDALARFGPRAAAASPQLREMTKSDDPRVSEAARKGLSALEGARR